MLRNFRYNYSHGQALNMFVCTLCFYLYTSNKQKKNHKCYTSANIKNETWEASVSHLPSGGV